MNNSQVPRTQVTYVLAAWLLDSHAWDTGGAGIDLALYTNDKIPSPSDTITDYTACTFTGAAAKPTLVADQYSFTDGVQAIALPSLAAFTPLAEPDPPLMAYGWFAKNHANGVLVAAARFTDPILLHDGVTIAFQVIVSAPLNWQFPNPVLP